MPDDLQTVYEHARARAGETVWPRLSAHEQTVAVYQELRAVDENGVEPRGQWPADSANLVSFATNQPISIRLRLTGQMEAWTVASENVLPTGRKTRALLAVIALSAPRPVSRARLAELIWSRRPEEQARASLRQEIQLLLRALAPAKTEILRVTRDHLSLVPGATWVDADEITRSSSSKPAALSLVDGELLEDLDGVDPAFDMWLTTERERLRDRARSMTEALMREQSEPAVIITAAQRLLQIDRAHEEAWRALMRAYAAQGERGMAVQAYDRCRAVLADMLDAEPSAETQTLLNAIRGPSSKRLPPRPPRPPAEMAPRRDGPPAAIGREATPGPRQGARVGVLPLRSVGMPDDVAYLGPSLANEITTALTRFRRLSVVSSHSLSRIARGDQDDATNPRARVVDFLLDGAIQRGRNKLRVTLRLLDLNDDNQVVWARRFDRPADDLLAVQEEISGEVAAQIDPIILLTEARRAALPCDPDDSAYGQVLRSVPLILRLDRDGFMRAGEQLAKATTLEPELAEACTWYATWHCLLIAQYWAEDPAAAGDRAAEFADRATILDPFSEGAFSIAGHIRTLMRRSPREGAALHERALELNPNMASAWGLAAIADIALGEVARAEQRYQRYKALSPLDPYSFVLDGLYAFIHLSTRDYEAGVIAGRAVTQLHPSYATGYIPYLVALGYLDREQEAAGILRRLRVVAPDVTIERCLRAFPFHQRTEQEHFAAGLRRAGLT